MKKSISVLITQCLQKDFVQPITMYEPVPNPLHVGYEESLRLMGENPQDGALAQFMNWAHHVSTEELKIIHIRDWHDSSDLKQQNHLQVFGNHCLAGTKGAEFVEALQISDQLPNNEIVINSLTLNDFVDTPLTEIIEKLKQDYEEVKIGVIGVWTEAKVSFILYELKTRFGIDQLATCSALTASDSKDQHFNALAQLKKILNVAIFDSVAEFATWFKDDAFLQPMYYQNASIEVVSSVPLSEAEESIFRWLYRNSSKIEVSPISGGFSGAKVFQIKSIDDRGSLQAPSVVKIGNNHLIGQERNAFLRISDLLGNNAPRINGFIDFGKEAGIKYSFASMGNGRVKTFQELYENGENLERVKELLNETLYFGLAPLYENAHYERMPLFEYYEFTQENREMVIGSVNTMLKNIDTPEMELLTKFHLREIKEFYQKFLSAPFIPRTDYHYVSYLHGDLNGANILIDRRNNPWIIDFCRSEKGHVMKDLLKLENDILYIMTPINNLNDLKEGLEFVEDIVSINDIKGDIVFHREYSEKFFRAGELIRCLRNYGKRLIHEDRSPLQLWVGLLRYAGHVLIFDESSFYQKIWALGAIGILSNKIKTMIDQNRVLRVDWVPLPENIQGKMGITVCPGREDRGRNLQDDIQELKRQRVQYFLTFLPDDELERVGVPNLSKAIRNSHISCRRVPIPDHNICSQQEIVEIVERSYVILKKNKNLVLSCMGGLGRSGTIAACILVRMGISPQDAIKTIRKTRGSRAIETLEQERAIYDYASSLEKDDTFRRLKFEL